MKDILCLLDYIRGTVAIKLKVDINILDYYDTYKTEPELKEENFISLGKLIKELFNFRNCREISTEIRKVLPNKMSNYLATEYALYQLRADIEGFTIGGDKGPV